MLTPFVSRLDELSLDWMWKDRPLLASWWDRIRQRPSFDTVFSAYPNPARKAGLRQAGAEVRQTVADILSQS